MKTLELHLSWTVSFLSLAMHERPVPVFVPGVVLAQPFSEEKAWQVWPKHRLPRGRGRGRGRGAPRGAAAPRGGRGRGRGRARGRGRLGHALEDLEPAPLGDEPVDAPVVGGVDDPGGSDSFEHDEGANDEESGSSSSKHSGLDDEDLHPRFVLYLCISCVELLLHVIA